MKNLTRIFLVVAALVAVSCTTDVTEDLGVAVDGQTEFVLSLEESRTQLGEKAGEVYPLYWSKGDKISVNGVESNEAAIGGNGAVATFAVSGVLDTPYCIAYPAAKAGEVLFAEQQAYTEGTFANGASTMYGYSENGGGVQLNHLTGVLKIGVVGEKSLSYAQISTVDRAPIAGAFALDFTTGEVSATAQSKEVISYSFGEGLALSTTPSYIHVAVPAGVYGELYVTLYDNEGGVMYATVKANDEKPLKAGAVREFTNAITYAPNAAVLVVKDKASLLAFAAQAAELEKNVLFVADVDMTGEEWTPIEGYAKSVLGNGYSIKGLSAPLFGTTSASIKGLHLKDVVLASNNATHYGGLACKVVSTEATTPAIEHCSVSGTFVIENKEYTPVVGNSDKKYANDDAKAAEMAYGGLVGLSCGATISNCVNNVAITVLQIAKDGDTTDITPAIGGVTGNAFYAMVGEAKVFTKLEGCVNNGTILYKDNSCSTEKFEIFPAVGGITGAVYHNTGLTKGTNDTGVSVVECTNRGNITIQAVTGGQGQDTQGYPQSQIGGVIGRGAYVSISGCKNYGKITLDGTFAQAHVGGVTGTSYYSDVLDCHNYGEIYMSETSTFHGLSIGGISALNYSTADYTFRTEDCSNNAPINCFGSVFPDVAAGGVWHYRVGGIEAFGRSFAKNNVNNKEGDIHIKGNIISIRKTDMFCEVGGVCAYRTTCSWSDCKNYGDITSEITFTVHSGVENNTGSVTDRSFFIGGVGAYSSQQLTGCENYGNILVKGSYTGEKLYVGGAAGYAPLNNTKNYGKVAMDESCTTSVEKVWIGGVLGGNDATEERTGVANYGELHIGGNHASPFGVGGCAGQCRHGGYKWENHGDIYVTGYNTQPYYIGGVIGQFVRHYAKDGKAVEEGSNGPIRECVNYGNLYATLPNGTGNTLHFGGVCRQCQHTMSGCVNNGDAFISGSIGNTLYYGGLCSANSACLRENSVNNGNITVTSPIIGSAASGADCFLGGLCYSGGSNTTYRNCVNNGDLIIEKDVKIANCCRIGGLIANVETADKTNIIDACQNNGNIIIKGTTSAQSGGVCRIGGLFGQFTNGTVKILNGFKNTGTIEFAGLQNKDSGTAVAGIVGGVDGGTWSTESTGNIINEGEIKFTGKTVGTFYVGGISAFMNSSVPAAPVKVINVGNITCTGTAKTYTNATISGICGNLKAPLDNAECYCEIYAPGYGAAGIGMISGKDRTETVKFTNVKIGGRICTERDDEDESEKWVTLSETNLHGLLYKLTGTPMTDELVAADGVTILTSKDQIDYTTLPAPTPEAGTEE